MTIGRKSRSIQRSIASRSCASSLSSKVVVAFAGVTGADAGLYHETTLVLPAATLCTTNPREKPAAWRCHVETNDRYTLALELHGATLRRIGACLGDTWSTERIQDKGYLRLDVLTRGDDAPRVQLVTTLGPKYRLLVTVFAK